MKDEDKWAIIDGFPRSVATMANFVGKTYETYWLANAAARLAADANINKWKSILDRL